MDSSGLAAGAAITILITLTLLAVGKFGQESHSDLEAALRLLYRNESPKKPRKSFFLFLSPVGAEKWPTQSQAQGLPGRIIRRLSACTCVPHREGNSMGHKSCWLEILLRRRWFPFFRGRKHHRWFSVILTCY